jgi:DNA invertase Pin-like site-specific DNA recombinase
MAEGKFVSYLRVSTARQGRSGLGLEAQRQAVEDFLNGGNWQLVKEFVEIESGKKADRPQLEKAFQLCRLIGAKLVIAKLDRLSRDAHFLLGLEKAGVDFVAADMPQANRLTIGIMAVMAQHEHVKLAVAARQEKARARASDLVPIVQELQAAGCESLRAIAAGLEERGIPAARGGKWSAVQVSRLLEAAGVPFESASAAV